MNYYIQGDAAKAVEIKAAFEKLGCDTGNLVFTSSQLYYTIEGRVELMCTKSLQNLIKTHPDYKELELPVEPKFKVGDWLVSDGENLYQLIDISDGRYKLVDMHMKVFDVPFSFDSSLRKWTIEDAKDGDVLATDNGWTCIFKAFDGWTFSSYCFMDSENWFCEFGSEAHTPNSRINGNIHPATKEQRDLLFAKMREAGYEWDAEKKELHKIKHYAIANFRPFDKVLVRCGNDEEWMIEFYCKYDTLVHTSPHRDYPFMGIGDSYSQCIPFNDDTKHLLGTTDMPDEMYINW